MATKLLTAMLLFAHICEGALIRKSTAHNFLHKIRQRRGFECSPGGCSAEVSEAGELAEVEEGNESLSLMQNGAAANKDTITVGVKNCVGWSNLGPEGSGAASSNKRLQQTQAQVDEVVDIMRVNVDKVLERDQKLSELDDRADALQAGASQFETSAAKLKRKYWWKNCKMWAILIAVIVIIIIVIIIWSST
ncbi:Vesicle-associated membrane protein 3 [Oryzias melastigma]|uniref:Vesicle-associated membrane protein 3 n=1 Tax=Oryzias melastigma TaxID=30732 RepID=A0A834FK80_ORYME|nr:Vesicle-associated membrane protein 3 [Oryzias melastigma]